MSKRRLFTISFIVLGAFQLLQSFPIFRLGWPISNYALYTSLPGKEFSKLEITLEDKAGVQRYAATPQLLPLPYFLANGFFRYQLGHPHQNYRNRFFDHILQINQEPNWSDRLGIYPPLAKSSEKLKSIYVFQHFYVFMGDIPIKEGSLLLHKYSRGANE